VTGRIHAEDIAAVRERANVADVVGDYVTLRPAGGGSLKGLCPFHDEKTPSFNVNAARGFWHCFGCSAGGDVIGFVMQIDHLTFVEAVERLAAKANVTLRYEQAGPAPVRQGGTRARLVAAHAEAARFYAELLAGAPEAAAAREFLSARGFDLATAQPYGCGFAPAGWDQLTRHLLARGFTERELTTGGLAREGRSGSLIDRFRRRLLWPIRDLAGDVVGFGARRIFDDDDGPKYLNTPETPVYKKSHLLYGIDLAKREIARQRRAVIVEGYTDVMACHVAGVPTAVATCGTAFGAEHIGVLRRLLMDADGVHGEVVFTFDGDEAGQKAALRAFDEDQRFVAQTFVTVQPDGMDPCELRQAKGDTAVRELVERREPLFAFALRAVLSRFDLDTAEGRVQALDRAAPLVARIRDRALRPEYARRLAGDLGMPVEVVVRRVAEAASGRPGRAPAAAPAAPAGRPAVPGGRSVAPAAGPPTAPATAGSQDRVPPAEPARPRPADPNLRYERDALKLALQAPVACGPAFDGVGQDCYSHPVYAAIRAAVSAAGGAAAARDGPAWVTAVADACPDPLGRSVVGELAVEPLPVENPDAGYAEQVLARLQLPGLQRQLAELQSRLQRLESAAAAEESAAVAEQLFAVQQHWRVLRDQAAGGR